MCLSDCHNFHDFRALAQRRLPEPIFNDIDGAADDEKTHRQNTASFDRCDLVPNVLRGVADVDISVTVMGQRLAMPFYCSPTALQRLLHLMTANGLWPPQRRNMERCSACRPLAP